MEELLKYIVALTNLYGVVSKDKVLEIYNDQNEDQRTYYELKRYLNDNISWLQESKVYYHNRSFICATIYSDDEVDELLVAQYGKLYYVPPKDELLNYVDEAYFEKSASYYNLYDFIKENFDLTGQKIEDACTIIHALYHGGYDYDVTLNFLRTQSIVIESGKQEAEFRDLYMDFSRHVRMWEDNGHKEGDASFCCKNIGIKNFQMYTYPNETTKAFLFLSNKEIIERSSCKCGSGKRSGRCCFKKAI